MVQAVDGNWYGYFADSTQANIADGTTTVSGQGLDYGSICIPAQAETAIGTPFSQAINVALNSESCTALNVVNGTNNVVREAKLPNSGSGNIAVGQIGINAESWPFVQLYDLSPGGNVVGQYDKGGVA